MSGQLWWLCPHLKTEPHRAPDGRYCPGGHAVTDIEAFEYLLQSGVLRHPVEGGEAVRYCEKHKALSQGGELCHQAFLVAYRIGNPNPFKNNKCVMVECFLTSVCDASSADAIPLSNSEGEKP